MAMVGDSYEYYDRRFYDLTVPIADVELLYDGCRWAEGPVWFADHGALVWSDIPNQRLLRWIEGQGVSVFRSRTEFVNGNTRDRQGRLVSCEHGGRRVIRLEPDGSITTIADRHDGKRLNSPNDVVVKSDGSIWFTDPTYGIDSDYEGHAAPSEIGASNVYRIDPADGTVAAVVTDMVQPNGIAFSLDERILYVADTGASHVPGLPATIRAYDVAADGKSLGPGRTFATCESGLFDGFRLDRLGNVWASSGDGVRCYAPDGTPIGVVPVPEVVSNLCFGGPNRNRLYITAQTSLYAIFVKIGGAPVAPA